MTSDFLFSEMSHREFQFPHNLVRHDNVQKLGAGCGKARTAVRLPSQIEIGHLCYQPISSHNGRKTNESLGLPYASRLHR
jgi:hypothetical protein